MLIALGAPIAQAGHGAGCCSASRAYRLKLATSTPSAPPLIPVFPLLLIVRPAASYVRSIGSERRFVGLLSADLDGGEVSGATYYDRGEA